MTTNRRLLALLLVAVTGAFGGGSARASPAAPAGFTCRIGPDVGAPQLNHVDSDPAILHDRQGRFWLIYSDGGSHWHTLSGTSIDNLAEQSVFDANTHFARPNGDDCYWIIGAWIDPKTQVWYATAHVEFHYGAWGHKGGFSHYRRIVLAASQDQGRTWKLRGDIVTPPYPTTDDAHAYPGPKFYFGDGDQKLFVDTKHGFFYLFYMSAWIDKTTGERGAQLIHAARAPIAKKMTPGSWSKWHGGRWEQPGLGGQESALVSADSFTVFWNSYLGEYQAIVNAGEGHFYACRALENEQWTDQGQIGSGKVLWYNWPIDSDNLTGRFSVGQTFRLYSADNDFNNVGAKYMTVTLRRAPR